MSSFGSLLVCGVGEQKSRHECRTSSEEREQSGQIEINLLLFPSNHLTSGRLFWSI